MKRHSDSNDALPQLAPPGAGLPRPELFVARRIFRWGLWCSNRAKAVTTFAEETDRILNLVHGLEPKAATRRVLIVRLRGLEDSSRFWSVCMTLDHLRIVNDSVTGILTELVAGRIPPGVASTADVKPREGIDSSVIPAYQESCRTFQETVAAMPDLATRVTFPHPWFGELDATAWHFLAGFHQRLHRRQIQRIISGI